MISKSKTLQRNLAGLRGFDEPEAPNNLFKGSNVFVKVVSLSSVVIKTIKPFVGDESTVDAFDLQTIFVLKRIDCPESRDPTYFQRGVLKEAKV